jgi:hypothetical protein
MAWEPQPAAQPPPGWWAEQSDEAGPVLDRPEWRVAALTIDDALAASPPRPAERFHLVWHEAAGKGSWMRVPGPLDAERGR